MATIKTFAGGAIPDWALSSARQTTRDLNSIVSSITDAYLRQQRLKQQQEQFDEQMQFRKDNLEYNRNLAIQQEEDLAAQRREQKRRFDTEFKFKQDRAELVDVISSIESATTLSDLNSFDTKTTYLNTLKENPEYLDNKFVQNRIDTEIQKTNRDKKSFITVRKNVKEFMFPGMDDDEIDEMGGSVSINAITQKYIQDPDNFFGTARSRQLNNSYLSNAFPGFNFTNDKDQKALTDALASVNNQMLLLDSSSPEYARLDGVRSGMISKLEAAYPSTDIEIDSLINNPQILKDYSDKTGLTLGEIQSKIKDGSLTEDMILGIGNDNKKSETVLGVSNFSPETQAQVKNELIEGAQDFVNSLTGFVTPTSDDAVIDGPQELSFRGVRALTVPGSEKTDENGNVSIELSYEDKPNERVALSAIQDQLQPPIGEQPQTAGMSSSDTSGSEEVSFNESLMSTPAAQTVVNVLDGAKELDATIPGTSLNIGSVTKTAANLFETVIKGADDLKNYVSDLWADTKTDDPRAGFFGALGEVRPGAGQTINRVTSTLLRFFPQAMEDYNLVKSGEWKEFAGQGLSGYEILKKTREKVRERGGVYYVGADSNRKYITKKQMIGQGHIIMRKKDNNDPSADIDEYQVALSKLPNKMINPAYIEKEIYDAMETLPSYITRLTIPVDSGVIAKDRQNTLFDFGTPVQSQDLAGIAKKAVKISKNEVSKIKKDMLKLQNLISKAEDYNLPDTYKYSNEGIDRIIQMIDSAVATNELLNKKRAEGRPSGFLFGDDPFPTLTEVETNEFRKAAIEYNDAVKSSRKKKLDESTVAYNKSVQEMRDAEMELLRKKNEEFLKELGIQEQRDRATDPFGVLAQ